MFGRRKVHSKSTESNIPKLNQEPYEGTIEEVLKHERKNRKEKVDKQDTQALFETYRRRLDQNITTSYSRYLYAGFWPRLWSLVIDLVLVKAIQAITFAIISFFLVQDLNLVYPIVSYLVNQLILIFYFALSSFWMNGQTLGKGLMGLQLVTNNYYKLPFSTAFIREGLGKFILIQFPILALFAVISPKRQNFMDYFTDTNVISLKQFKFLYEENRI